jgi:recombination protein RecT
VLTGLQLGLEINTPLGQCYIIPYKREVTFQLGYQGLLELAYRSNKYKRIDAEVVYKGDEFKYEYGLDAYLKHKPCGVRENPQYVYALYELTNGGKAFKVWTWKAVMKHAEEYSQSYGSASSPWKSKHLETVEAMAKKTLLISALKYAPKSVEIAQAITADESGVQAKIVEDGSHTFVDFDFKKPQIEAPNESLKTKPKAAAPAENQDEADGENEEAVPRKKRSVTNLFEKDEAAALEEQYERAMQRDYPDFA